MNYFYKKLSVAKISIYYNNVLSLHPVILKGQLSTQDGNNFSEKNSKMGAFTQIFKSYTYTFTY